MTGQNVTRAQLPDCFRESLSAVRERDSENCKIDILYPRVWWRAGDSTGIDVNSLAGSFDHKCERFADAPVERFDGWLQCCTLTSILSLRERKTRSGR